MKNVINEKRVFIGIPISAIIKPVLSVLKSKFTQNSENIKWIPSENIHLTLKFLGNISVNDLVIKENKTTGQFTNSYSIIKKGTHSKFVCNGH